MAYRGLGDTAKAEEHLKQWKNTEVLVPDPFRQELDLALESGLSYELRGVRALEQRDFKAAADFFKKGVDITPGTAALGRSLRHKLATALYLQGDVRGAMKWFEETFAMAPANGIDETAAKAHYSLGVLMASSGRSQEAISHLSAAVRFSPNYVEAYQALADALRRSGKVEQSLTQYTEALRVNPEGGRRAIRLRHGAGSTGTLSRGARLVRRGLAAQSRSPGVPLRTGPSAGRRARRSRSRRTASAGDRRAPAPGQQDDRPRRDDGDGAGRTRTVRRGRRDPTLRSSKPSIAIGLDAGHQAYDGESVCATNAGQPCRMPWANDDPIHSPGPPIDPVSSPPRRRPAAP